MAGGDVYGLCHVLVMAGRAGTDARPGMTIGDGGQPLSVMASQEKVLFLFLGSPISDYAGGLNAR